MRGGVSISQLVYRDKHLHGITKIRYRYKLMEYETQRQIGRVTIAIRSY